MEESFFRVLEQGGSSALTLQYTSAQDYFTVNVQSVCSEFLEIVGRSKKGQVALLVLDDVLAQSRHARKALKKALRLLTPRYLAKLSLLNTEQNSQPETAAFATNGNLPIINVLLKFQFRYDIAFGFTTSASSTP
jgi:hypothetical protein